MPDPPPPGVFIEEAQRPPAISAVATDVAGFVGVAEALPGVAGPAGALSSAAEFARHWSTAAVIGGVPNLLWPAAQGFFANGGGSLHIAAVAPADATAGGHVAAIARLAATDAAIIAAPDVQMLAPGVANTAMRALVALAGEPDSNCFVIVDPPAGLTIAALTDWRAAHDSADAALYWPWLQLPDGRQLPPSAWVAGVMAATDRTRGVWKAPANVALAGVAAVTVLTAAQEDLLTPDGINTLRALPGRGLLVRGARTLSRDPEWRYVPVRRLAAMVSASVSRGLAWAVFEPQGAPLWVQARALVEDFLHALWRGGALAGTTPDEAFFVRCDATTMTAADIAEARLIVQIGFAPLRPGEFSILRIVVRTAP